MICFLNEIIAQMYEKYRVLFSYMNRVCVRCTEGLVLIWAWPKISTEQLANPEMDRSDALNFKLKYYAEKLVPQPQVSLALGLLNIKPLLFKPSNQSISIPRR